MLTGRAGVRGGVRHVLKPCKPVARPVVKQHSSRLQVVWGSQEGKAGIPGPMLHLMAL